MLRWLSVSTCALALALTACGPREEPAQASSPEGEDRQPRRGVTSAGGGEDATEEGAAREEPGGPAWRPEYHRPPVVDIHAHVMPSGLPRLAEIMRDNGVGLVVNLSGGSPGRGLEVSHAMQQRFPAIVNFYTPSWRRADDPDFAEEEAANLGKAVEEYGFRGLKVSKALGLYVKDAEGERIPVDDPMLDPLWEKAGELGVPVAIHTGDPKAFWEPVTPENERFEELSAHPGWSYHGEDVPSHDDLLAERDRLVARHRDTTFIGVHFANYPEDLAYVRRFLEDNPNVVVDTAARVPEIGRHPPEEVRKLFVDFQDRILFGTDLGVSSRGLMLGSTGEEPATMEDVKPFYDAHWRFFEGGEEGMAHPTPIQGDWTIDAIRLPEEVLEKLYRTNAERLLDLKRREEPAAD
ncbi:MAG: amidohydrolase family protein [Myxococcota bacterium]